MLPFFQTSVNKNPIHTSLYNIDYNDQNLNDELMNYTFKYEIKRNSISLYLYIFQETNILEIIKRMSNIKKINIKQVDVQNNVINEICVETIVTSDYDYKLKQKNKTFLKSTP